MTEKETINYSKTLFDKGYGCAEAVLMAIAENKGIKSDLVPRIATGFCGGMAKTNGLCGAVCGGVIAISIMYGRDHEKDSNDLVNAKVQKFIEEFNLNYGTTSCTNLTGCDLSTKDGLEKFDTNNMHAKCADFVEKATELSLKSLRI